MFALAIPIGIILLAIFLQSSNTAAASTAKAFVSWLVQVAHVEILGIKVNLGKVVGSAAPVVIKLTNYLTYAFGSLFEAQEKAAVAWIGGLQTYLDYITSRTFAQSFTMQRLAHWLVHVHIPAYVKAHAGSVTGAVTNITKIVKTFPTKLIYVTKTTEAHVKAGLVTGQKLITEASAAKVEALLPRIEKLYGKTEADLKALTKLIAHGKSLAVSRTAAATVAIGLVAIGSNWIRCDKNKLVGHAICKMPLKSLEGLLGLLGDALVFQSICAVLPTLEKGLELIEPEVVKFTSGAAAVLCRGRYKPSQALALPTLYTPTAVGLTLDVGVPSGGGSGGGLTGQA